MLRRLSTNGNGNLPNDDSSASSSTNGSSAPRNNEQPDGLFSQRAMKRIHDLFASQQLCDVVLKCGDIRIPAHRVVLAAASEFFDRMFNGSLMESNQCEVEVNGIEEPAVLRELVSYCYTGQIHLEESNVQAILSGACFLQLEDVIERCCLFIRSQMDASNCLGIRSFADAHGCINLRQAAHAFIMEHFMEVVGQSEYLALPIEHVVVLLSSDDVNVESESIIYEAVCEWVTHDIANRRQFASRLLSAVRLPCLSLKYLCNCVNANPLYREDVECQRLLKEAMEFHSMPDHRAIMNLGNRVQPRKSTVGTLYVIGGINQGPGPLTIERYDSLKNEWNDVGRMPDLRSQFGVAVLEGKVHLVGGCSYHNTLNNFVCWEPATNTLTQLTPMKSPRNGLAVAVLEGFIYALGGHDGASYLCTAERYDSATKSWTKLRQMSQARRFFGVAVVYGRIYAIGGRDHDQYLRSVERYNPHTNKWTHCAQMTKRRGYVGVGVLHGFIYAAGGLETTTTSDTTLCCVERYDPKTDSWTLIANMSSRRIGVGLCPLGNLLFAVGGYAGSKYLQSVECYDPIKNEWRKVGSLKCGRSSACMVVIPRHAQHYIESINGNI